MCKAVAIQPGKSICEGVNVCQCLRKYRANAKVRAPPPFACRKPSCLVRFIVLSACWLKETSGNHRLIQHGLLELVLWQSCDGQNLQFPHWWRPYIFSHNSTTQKNGKKVYRVIPSWVGFYQLLPFQSLLNIVELATIHETGLSDIDRYRSSHWASFHMRSADGIWAHTLCLLISWWTWNMCFLDPDQQGDPFEIPNPCGFGRSQGASTFNSCYQLVKPSFAGFNLQFETINVWFTYV